MTDCRRGGRILRFFRDPKVAQERIGVVGLAPLTEDVPLAVTAFDVEGHDLLGLGVTPLAEFGSLGRLLRQPAVDECWPRAELESGVGARPAAPLHLRQSIRLGSLALRLIPGHRVTAFFVLLGNLGEVLLLLAQIAVFCELALVLDCLEGEVAEAGLRVEQDARAEVTDVVQVDEGAALAQQEGMIEQVGEGGAILALLLEALAEEVDACVGQLHVAGDLVGARLDIAD